MKVCDMRPLGLKAETEIHYSEVHERFYKYLQDNIVKHGEVLR